MKKIIVYFSVLLLPFFCLGQSYQLYQWHGFNPGIFCDDSNATSCVVNNFAVDTERNTLWIEGKFMGSDTIQSPGIVGYKNGKFVEFKGVSSPLSNYNAIFVYQGQLATCNSQFVGLLDIDTATYEIIGSFPNGTYLGGLCFAEYKGDLYVGGHFSAIKGPTGGWVAATGVAKWNGNVWSALGSGLTGSGVFIKDMLVYNNKLTVGGALATAGGIPAWNIAQWNDTAWNNMWTGTGGYGTNDINNNIYGADIEDMELFENNLYIIGDFDSICGIPAQLAYWNGTNWTGTNYTKHATLFKSFLNKLLIFTTFNGVQLDWWENDSLYPAPQFNNHSVNVIETFNDTLFAGGIFTSSNGEPTFRIARLLMDTATGIGINQLTLNSEQLTVYPNPADEKLFIHKKEKTNGASVQVFNYTGQLIYENTNFKDESIDTRQLSNGIYLLRYSTVNYFSSVKFVVQH